MQVGIGHQCVLYIRSQRIMVLQSRGSGARITFGLVRLVIGNAISTWHM